MNLPLAPPPNAVLLDVRIPGRPRSKGRPRFDTRTGRAITPVETREWELAAADRFRYAWRKPCLPREMAVEVRLVAVYPRLKSQVDGPPGRRPCIGNADVDNIAKCVLDALVLARVIADDDLVVRLVAEKAHAADGEAEHVQVEVRPWTP